MDRFRLSLVVPVLVLLHLYWAPYTKVEESFNIQATHDILKHGIPTRHVEQTLAANYDHVDFPGSVPRTFVGAVVLAGLSTPWLAWLSSTEQVQMLVRGILGLFNAYALLSFRRAVDTAFGRVAGDWYILLQASQFHVIYYASRTLPNMFAFGLSTLALRNLLLVKAMAAKSRKSARRRRLALYLLTLAGVVFRSELAILLAAETAYLLLQHRVSLRYEIIPAGLAGLAIGLLATVSVDSFFWQRFPLWPELAGFYYNTIQGHSSAWGVSPPSFYFTNAIPRLLLNPLSYLLCIPLALLNHRTRQTSTAVLLPLLAFVAAYSALPHKEWRFVLYVVPPLTAVAAAGAAWLWTRRAKSLLHRLAALALVASVLASAAASLALLHVSSLNYPGAHALARLHLLADTSDNTSPINVYLGNLACQTGVTRFLQADGWVYDKTDDKAQLLHPAFWERFDYALVERPEKAIGKWEVLETVYGYAGVGLTSKSTPPSEAASAKHGDDDGKGRPGRAVKQLLGWGAEVWEMVKNVLMQRVTGGRWVEVRTEPKIRILKRAM
ncbi:Alg9-like mannosyltransferase family-domain-containing protein [Cryomyces antarcticus]